MKKIICFIYLLLFSSFVYSQKIDTLIDNGVYHSFFNYSLKEPIFVRYKLYNGGGDCSRKGFNFKSEDFTAKKKDYAHSGYDIGHLANAEDFAFDCQKDEATFRFYNALPQTANLNRGVWKVDETDIRELSKTDTLLILCGGVFNDSLYIGDCVSVPNYCWKIVYSYSQNKIVLCKLYTNTRVGATSTDISPSIIISYIKIDILKYLNYNYKNIN